MIPVLPLLKAIPLRFYLYAAIAAFIGYLLWREHYLTGKNKALTAIAAQATANLTAERAARAHEIKIANEASHEFQRTVKALEAAKSDTPVRSVRLCRSPTGYVPAPATAASGVDAGDANGVSPPPGFHAGYGSTDRFSDAGPDIGPTLYAEADRADELAARCNALIKWVRSR